MMISNIQRPMSHAEEMEILRAACTRLAEDFKDPVHGREHISQFLKRAGILQQDGKAVPYFAEVFGPNWDKRLQE